MTSSLVGSEMCIRDRDCTASPCTARAHRLGPAVRAGRAPSRSPPSPATRPGTVRRPAASPSSPRSRRRRPA
eukprot:6368835-Prorocentrum_lima.AAC.1